MEWKDVVGFEGLYKVSDTGLVKTVPRIDKLGRTVKEIVLKTRKNNRGYYQVHLHKDGKEYLKLVHRVVAMSFLPNPKNLPQINHKDEDKANNAVPNLEWCDNLYNRHYGTGYQRSVANHDYRSIGLRNSKAVRQLSLSGEFIAEYASAKFASEITGISVQGIRRCCSGYSKTAGKYLWQHA